MICDIGPLLDIKELKHLLTNVGKVPVNSHGKLSFAAFTSLIPKCYHDLLIDWIDLFDNVQFDDICGLFTRNSTTLTDIVDNSSSLQSSPIPTIDEEVVASDINLMTVDSSCSNAVETSHVISSKSIIQTIPTTDITMTTAVSDHSTNECITDEMNIPSTDSHKLVVNVMIDDIKMQFRISRNKKVQRLYQALSSKLKEMEMNIHLTALEDEAGRLLDMKKTFNAEGVENRSTLHVRLQHLL